MRYLTIESEKHDDCHVVALTGKFSVEDSFVLREMLEELCEQKARCLVIDCKGLTQINSAAIGILLGIKMKAARYGGFFALTGINQVIEVVFKLTGVDVMIPVYSDVSAARTAAMKS